MDGDHRLIAGKVLLGEFFGNLQRQFRSDLAGPEGLDHMIILHPIHFSVGPLGVQRLAALLSRVAVEMCGEDMILRLIAVEDVLDPGVQSGFRGKSRSFF